MSAIGSAAMLTRSEDSPPSQHPREFREQFPPAPRKSLWRPSNQPLLRRPLFKESPMRKFVTVAGLVTSLCLAVPSVFAGAPPAAKNGSAAIVIVFKDGHRQASTSPRSPASSSQEPWMPPLSQALPTPPFHGTSSENGRSATATGTTSLSPSTTTAMPASRRVAATVSGSTKAARRALPGIRLARCHPQGRPRLPEARLRWQQILRRHTG